MERSERTIVRSFHAMAAARGIAERVERALASAAELERPRRRSGSSTPSGRARGRALELARRATARTPARWRAPCARWKDCFDVAAWPRRRLAVAFEDAAVGARAPPVVRGLEAAGAISLGKLAMTRWPGGDGPAPQPAVVPRLVRRPTASPAARPGVRGRSRDRPGRSAPGTDAGGGVRAARGGLRRRRHEADLGTRAPRWLHPVRDEPRRRRPLRPQHGRGTALRHAALTGAPPAELGSRASTGLRITFLGRIFTAALTITTSRRCSGAPAARASGSDRRQPGAQADESLRMWPVFVGRDPQPC